MQWAAEAARSLGGRSSRRCCGSLRAGGGGGGVVGQVSGSKGGRVVVWRARRRCRSRAGGGGGGVAVVWTRQAPAVSRLMPSSWSSSMLSSDSGVLARASVMENESVGHTTALNNCFLVVLSSIVSNV